MIISEPFYNVMYNMPDIMAVYCVHTRKLYVKCTITHSLKNAAYKAWIVTCVFNIKYRSGYVIYGSSRQDKKR